MNAVVEARCSRLNVDNHLMMVPEECYLSQEEDYGERIRDNDVASTIFDTPLYREVVWLFTLI